MRSKRTIVLSVTRRFACGLSLFLVAPGFAADATNLRTILLVDDRDVLYRPGTKRVLRKPVRHERNPVVAETKPWELAIGYCSVYRDATSGRYQLWYQAYAGGRAKDPTQRVVVCYAESEDGVHWNKPNLGLYSFNAIHDTNIVLVGNGGRSVNYCAAVIVDPRDLDSAKRYKMAYWDFAVDNGTEYPGLCVAFSPDGIHWHKYPQAPLLRAAYGVPGPPPFHDERTTKPLHRPGEAISDVIDLTYGPPHNEFVIYAKTWIDGPDGSMFWKRAVVRTRSKDFVHWSEPQLVLAPDESEVSDRDAAAGVQLHGGPVFFHEGVYFSLLQVLDLSGPGTMPAELAISRNGIDWTRPFRGDYFIPVAGDGKSFDAGCLWTNAMPVFLDDEIRFYYGAYPAWNSDQDDDPSGIGMVALPRDRFAGIRPLDGVGQITFKPRDFSGGTELSINADASAGNIRVEVLTADGYRVRGYSKDDAIAIRGDGLRHSVRWTDKTKTTDAAAAKIKGISDLPGGRYRLRIHLDDAEVFAVSLGIGRGGI